MTTRQPEEHLDVRLVVHTHWDREWYRPFPQFRARLISLIDGILDGHAGAPFLLDGQACVLEDYLEVRPERSAEVSSALRSGVIEAGPWYVLADALIPSAEGLIRNLLAGRRVLRSLRATPPGVLYCPDSFGHPACLPSIAAGFGIGVVVLWRGYGGARHPVGDTFHWLAPDESDVVVHHLPPDGYEFGSHLPAGRDAAQERWASMQQVFRPRASTGLVLLTAGADHHEPQANLSEAVAALTLAAEPSTVTRSSLDDFGRALRERAARTALTAVRGELRDSYGYTWTLQGTLGARAALKRAYARTERLLIRDVEPWVALARLRRADFDRRALAREAWKPVLLSQPHDTLCGCSVDAVATAMSGRLADATAAAVELRDSALMHLLGHDANEVRRQPLRWKPVTVIRNSTARTRSGVVELDVDLVLDDAPVGPASAGIEPRHRRTGAVAIGTCLTQELSRQVGFAREEASRHYPWNRLVERRRILAWSPEVPGYGLLTTPIEEKRRKPVRPPVPVTGERQAIRSSGLRAEVAGESLRFVSDAGGTIDDWIVMEAEGERGDLYTRSAIPGTRTTGKLERAKVTMRGPLRAELTCDWTLRIPERRLTTASGRPIRAAAVRQRVQTLVQLDAGAAFARLIVRGENRTSDVRLRIGLCSGLASPVVVADAAFGPVERKPIIAPEARSRETPPPTAPLHRYVSSYAADRGVTVISDGLAEYEVGEDGITWVTLVRAVGELSRHDLPERPGHAGYPEPVPDAQSIGPFEATLAFLPHGPRSEATTTLVEQATEDVLLPLRGDTLRPAIDPPARVTGVELAGDGLAFSSMKESDDGEWLVLRCVNLCDRPVEGAWGIPGVREAMRARLDEMPLETLPHLDGTVRFRAPPRGPVTILVR